MEIIIADNSGFCFGVSRSVDLANEALESNKEKYTVGPLIHNPQLVKSYEKQGLKLITKKKSSRYQRFVDSYKSPWRKCRL